MKSEPNYDLDKDVTMLCYSCGKWELKVINKSKATCGHCGAEYSGLRRMYPKQFEKKEE